MAATINPTTSSMYPTTIYHQDLELLETDNFYPISSQQKEIIQAVWLGHIQRVQDLLTHQPTLINTQFKADVITSVFSASEGEEYNLDKYPFIYPKKLLMRGTVKFLGFCNLQHLACHKRNLKMAILIHQLQPTLFFQGQKDSPLRRLLKDNNNQDILPFFEDWLSSGTLDDYLFHRYEHSNLAHRMIKNNNLSGLTLIFQRACDSYINQLLVASIPLPDPIDEFDGANHLTVVANLITSYCRPAINLRDSSPINSPMIQANINAMIHRIDLEEYTAMPLLFTAMSSDNPENIMSLLFRCGADPDQPITVVNTWDRTTQTYSIRYCLFEGDVGNPEKITSIFERLGRGTPTPHSIHPATAPILKLKAKPKTKSKACCIS